MNKINKLLIANRGEIAVRIIQTAKNMGISTIALFAESDNATLHIQEADKSISLGDGELTDTYLNIDKIISIAIDLQADAIHPGYGFLAENPDFAKKCGENNIIFIGPSPEAIRIMGNKSEAAEFVSRQNIPLPDTRQGEIRELNQQMTEKDFPVMIKASAGGGGKGMRVVREKKHLEETLKATAREAKNYFGNDAVYIEKYIENPKHIEIQILGDNHGNYIHLFERECSIQRRHQKIIEESPSPSIDNKTREEMGKAAVKIAETIGYSGAGTVEFLVDENKNFFFLEMNTRIQVEHPVTEMITGIDLVREQIRIAEDMPLQWTQNQVKPRGHAVEARIYAENPENNFFPSPGKIHQLIFPARKDLRVDTGIKEKDEISSFYDPLIAKMIAWDETRKAAINRLRKGLEETTITGIRHNLNYLAVTLNHRIFRSDQFTTGFIPQYHKELLQNIESNKQHIDKQLLKAAFVFIHSINQSDRSKEHVWNQIGYWRPFMMWELNIDNEKHHFNFTRNNRVVIINPGHEAYRAELVYFAKDHLTIQTNNIRHTIYFSQTGVNQTEIMFKGYFFCVSYKNYREIVQNKAENQQSKDNSTTIRSPMFGKVLKIEVKPDMPVKKGQILAIVEAMKMENSIMAPYDTTIRNIVVSEGQQVKDGQPLMETYSM